MVRYQLSENREIETHSGALHEKGERSKRPSYPGILRADSPIPGVDPATSL